LRAILRGCVAATAFFAAKTNIIFSKTVPMLPGRVAARWSSLPSPGRRPWTALPTPVHRPAPRNQSTATLLFAITSRALTSAE
jgi:hypothetical protein